MSFARWIKARVYPALPSQTPKWHEKRRKGLAYRYFSEDGLECQREQDRLFWSLFIRPELGGRFLEIGGDGVTGSHTLGLELLHGWDGAIYVEVGKPLKKGRKIRKCQVLAIGEVFSEPKQVDLLAIHRPMESATVLEVLQTGKLRPKWVIVENRKPDPQWCRLLESLGYRMNLFFHDDEYYQLKGD